MRLARATAEERALARASAYRLLALAFSYPSPAAAVALQRASAGAETAFALLDPAVAEAADRLNTALRAVPPGDYERRYQGAFTLSYSEDCPLYETAFSARHLFQQTQQQADIAGFYRAFSVEPGGERPDHLALELEFMYLLTLKEAHARDQGDREAVAVCRGAQRSFLRDHLARWAPLVAGRIVALGAPHPYPDAARLLAAFVTGEERYLRLGEVSPFRDEPVLIADEPGDMTCPIAAGASSSLEILFSGMEVERAASN